MGKPGNCQTSHTVLLPDGTTLNAACRKLSFFQVSQSYAQCCLFQDTHDGLGLANGTFNASPTLGAIAFVIAIPLPAATSATGLGAFADELFVGDAARGKASELYSQAACGSILNKRRLSVELPGL